MITLSIDGRTIGALDGETILEAADRVGIEIPTLCHHPAVTPYGACRLCIVEVEQGGRRRMVTSCIFPVREGMVVWTNNERVQRIRRGVMELLLARCPHAEQIRELAEQMGVREPRLEVENEGCILCGLCVRCCEEIAGACAISFINRGPEREVAAPYLEPSQTCIGCGGCAYICPTRYIKIEDGAIKFGDRIIKEVSQEESQRVLKVLKGDAE